MNFTDEQIRAAYLATFYTTKPHHEHPDCVRIAYQWLSAQQMTSRPSRRAAWPLKHIIESWGGRYVSMNDVVVAATLLGLEGRYPYFSISSRLTRPSMSRLRNIGEALTQKNYLFSDYDDCYSRFEGRR